MLYIVPHFQKLRVIGQLTNTQFSCQLKPVYYSMKYSGLLGVLAAQSQPNATKLIRQCFTVQIDKDPKRTAKATQEYLKAKKWDILQWPVT